MHIDLVLSPQFRLGTKSSRLLQHLKTDLPCVPILPHPFLNNASVWVDVSNLVHVSGNQIIPVKEKVVFQGVP